ncbi:hypothetical protein OIDMADRAFT_157038 [Oidiodendron maius Zn]|uniref:Amino acid permease/ SLC12A domain-containing protein n=1 Tax=Oidiodendron maius (strain Zn) TaxID=913774 RepID=A0A0C3HR65_OIDMZ|nr:hypothetical protein OIDMADRAFT_157038 [Oidiodendron maius Zn]
MEEIRHEGEKERASVEKAVPEYTVTDSEDGVIVENIDGLQRHLGARQIQMIAIGGSIGTALFVSIGSGLVQGGPGSLFIAFTLYCFFLATVNNCMAEMAIFMPVSGSFVRMGSKWVDEAFGFMLGWNFFLYESFLIPWEISALNIVLTFWSNDIPLGAICAACSVLYGLINIFAVKWYGESEFWLSSGKGAFAEYITTGSLGRFEGFLSALWKAAFTIVGPEYIAMMSGEAAHPRKNLKRAFKTIYFRFGVFFIGGALACGIVIPYNDPTLNSILNSNSSATGTAASSPYVIAMQNLGIDVLPHITNALLVTSIFSAGNSYVYCASRTLHSLALDGHAPKFLRYCTKNGVPLWCYCVTMIFPFFSFLALGSSSAQVITWFANLTEASQIIDYISMCIIYLYFYRALKAQGYDRKQLPYFGWCQPYCAWFGLVTMIFTVIVYGYTTFLPGWWDVGTFFSYYTMCFVCPILYVGWKIFKKSKLVKPEEADLIWERPRIDAYEASLTSEGPGFWEEVRSMMGLKKKIPEHIE